MSALVSATRQKRGMVKMDVETITPVHLGERVGRGDGGDGVDHITPKLSWNKDKCMDIIIVVLA